MASQWLKQMSYLDNSPLGKVSKNYRFFRRLLPNLFFVGGLFIEEKHTDFVRDSAYMVHKTSDIQVMHIRAKEDLAKRR